MKSNLAATIATDENLGQSIYIDLVNAYAHGMALIFTAICYYPD